MCVCVVEGEDLCVVKGEDMCVVEGEDMCVWWRVRCCIHHVFPSHLWSWKEFCYRFCVNGGPTTGGCVQEVRGSPCHWLLCTVCSVVDFPPGSDWSS